MDSGPPGKLFGARSISDGTRGLPLTKLTGKVIKRTARYIFNLLSQIPPQELHQEFNSFSVLLSSRNVSLKGRHRNVTAQHSTLLRPYDGAIKHAVISPGFEGGLVGIFRGRPLVDVDTPARLIVSVHVTLADFGRTGKHFARLLVKKCFFLNSEVGGGEVQMEIVAMADRVDIVRPVPCRPHVEELAAMRYFPAHVQATHG